MDIETTGSGRTPGRTAALVSGISGIVANVFLIGFYTLEPLGVALGGLRLGTVNDALGAVQFAALVPVVVALGRHLPQTAAVRVAWWVGVLSALAAAVLGVLLVARVLTFETQIVPELVALLGVVLWLLVVSVVGHRTRALPRAVTGLGLLLSCGLLLGGVLAGAGALLAPPTGTVVAWAGYAVGGLAWLALPVWVLLLAPRVFSRPAVPAAAAAVAVGER